jgi:hypothetical protein
MFLPDNWEFTARSACIDAQKLLAECLIRNAEALWAGV